MLVQVFNNNHHSNSNKAIQTQSTEFGLKNYIFLDFIYYLFFSNVLWVLICLGDKRHCRTLYIGYNKHFLSFSHITFSINGKMRWGSILPFSFLILLAKNWIKREVWSFPPKRELWKVSGGYVFFFFTFPSLLLGHVWLMSRTRGATFLHNSWN